MHVPYIHVLKIDDSNLSELLYLFHFFLVLSDGVPFQRDISPLPPADSDLHPLSSKLNESTRIVKIVKIASSFVGTYVRALSSKLNESTLIVQVVTVACSLVGTYVR